jgi:hypothetical protein
MPWFEAIDQPGADQMRHGKKLLLSRPFLTRIPDDGIIVTDRVPTSVPGAGRYRFVATRDEAGTYAMVYAPVGRKFKVHMDKISGATVKAWWFNPRTGSATVHWRIPQHRRTRSSCRRTQASTWTGCWCWMTPRNTTRRPANVDPPRQWGRIYIIDI